MMKLSSAFLAVVLLGLLAAAPPSTALRALGMFPLAAHSHNIFFKALMEALVDRGHEVVLFSPFPPNKVSDKCTFVDTSQGAPSTINSFSFDKVSSASMWLPGRALYTTVSRIGSFAGPDLCRKVFAMPEFDKLMRGGYGRFDVVVTEIFGSDCWAAVAHKLGVPLVSMVSNPDMPWMHARLGSPDNPSYLNNVFSSYTGAMTLWQRLINACSTVYMNALHRAIIQAPSDLVVREFLGADMPTIEEMVRNTSLVLLNRHVGLHAARPLTPHSVLVGGLHIKPATADTLDPELARWMDGAEHGVIFFSLGSMMRSDTLPVEKRNALLAAFAKLPQRVLWKFETADIELPANVRIGKWLPQMAILSHPKTVLFMTHSGLMGSMEAIYSGVPMLGMPLFGDQHSNTEQFRVLGVAERMDLRTVTEDSALEVLRKLTEDPKYRQRAREMSALFRDRPRQASDEAVWWVEYVVRHGGAPHLRPLAVDMPLYQYLLLDVVGLILAGLFVAVIIVRKIVAAVLDRSSRSKPQSKKKRQ